MPDRDPSADPETPETDAGRVWEVFAAYLKLGLTSFGGPIAHIGYFRRELVERRRWVDDRQFGQLFAICQFLLAGQGAPQRQYPGEQQEAGQEDRRGTGCGRAGIGAGGRDLVRRRQRRRRGLALSRYL